MRGVLLVGLVLALAGCGGSGDSGDSGDSADASQVEASLKAQLEQGGGGRVVDLGKDPPKIVTCRKEGGEWRCTVKTTMGRSMLCIVPQGSQGDGRKVPLGSPPTCRGIDY